MHCASQRYIPEITVVKELLQSTVRVSEVIANKDTFVRNVQ